MGQYPYPTAPNELRTNCSLRLQAMALPWRWAPAMAPGGSATGGRQFPRRGPVERTVRSCCAAVAAAVGETPYSPVAKEPPNFSRDLELERGVLLPQKVGLDAGLGFQPAL